MNSYLLYGLLAGLAVQAAPAKRQCNRQPTASDAGNNFAVQTDPIPEAQTTSLSAVGAWANGHGRGSRSGHRSRTRRPPTSTGNTLSIDPTAVAPTPSTSDVLPADSSTVPLPTSEPAPSASDSLPAQPSDALEPSSTPAPPAGEPVDDATPTTTIDNNDNIARPTITSKTSSSAQSSTKTSASASAPTSGEGNAGSKRAGLAINEQSVKDFSAFLGGNMEWYTGWSMTPLPGTDGLEWVPQVWGAGDVANVKTLSAKWPSGVTHVVSFNEPDMTAVVGGSDINPTLAAQKHIEWVNNLGGNYKIGSPAVARGSLKWMDDWVEACAGKCQYDFVPFHFYGLNADDLITYAKDFHARYNKPLWLTEFACHDYSTGQMGTPDEVKVFMKTAIDWFKGEGASIVERYAWFGAFADSAAGGNTNGLQNTDGTPNALGEYYLSL